ncbi:protein bicaudal C homolog 1-A-like isoform X1 [Mytilus californianus]|uniref:protein bicaudal C homolog 1-A-like isoform X1 n=1 Tax=Mytilus californianus TaxID=6549 RepID=UPI0022472B0C|nr:protein bicaudal C homolog 1-A-like isoform X1 [Mytilus californianus]
MADHLSLCSDNMKDSRSINESPTDICDENNQDIKDELEPGFIEERFRVDRKKLEQMLQGSDHEEENAEDFFQRIMEESNTRITWPSKLKIGAKSKKDPHIKVVGYPEDVKSAKEHIMSILDTKSNRVTLKMDVSHTDHSHVIGKGGNNIKRVMQETGCHIHFPDSNRGNHVQEKSNQVSIAGQPAGVETARAQIRELLPLVFMFELPVTGLTPDSSSPLVQQLQQQYTISVTFRQRPRAYTTTVVVRGTVCNAKSVKEGTLRLMEQLTATSGVSLPVSMQLEIAPQHHLFIIGRGGMNIKQIMQQTGASIHFPDPNTVTPPRKGTVYVTGSIESVFMARQHLIGCLPLVLMFDVKDEIEIDQGKITQLMEHLDVFISVKPKPKQPSKSVIVKSIERNAPNMYLARLTLLGLKKDEKNFPPSCSTNSPFPNLSPNNGLGLSALGLFGPGLISVNTTNSLLMLNGHSPNTLGSQQSSPNGQSPQVNWVSAAPCIYPPMMVLNTPVVPTSVQSQLELLSQCNAELQKELSQNGGIKQASVSVNQVPSNNQSESNSPSSSPHEKGQMGRSQSAVELSNFQKSPNSFSGMITRENYETDPNSSAHTHDLLGLSKTVDNQSQKSLQLDSSQGRRSLESSLSHEQLRTSLSCGHLENSLNRARHESNLTQHNLESSLNRNNLANSLNQRTLDGSQNRSGFESSISRQTLEDNLNQTALANSLGRQALQDSISASLLANTLNKHMLDGSLNRNRLDNSRNRQLLEGGLNRAVLENSLGRQPLEGSLNRNILENSLGRANLDGSFHRAGLMNTDHVPDAEALGLLENHIHGLDHKDSTLFPFPFAVDYEERKLLATKAMQKKPEGESRTPTDLWSGMGFSKSMPAEAIRERLARQLQSMQLCDPNMTTTYESANEQLGEEIEHDPWNDQQTVPHKKPLNPAPGEYPSPRKKYDMCLSSSNHVDSGALPQVKPWWTTSIELAELFSKLGLGKYTDLFQQQEIDLSTFLTLTDQDLRELGVSTFGARRKMLLAITDLNKRKSMMNNESGNYEGNTTQQQTLSTMPQASLLSQAPSTYTRVRAPPGFGPQPQRLPVTLNNAPFSASEIQGLSSHSLSSSAGSNLFGSHGPIGLGSRHMSSSSLSASASSMNFREGGVDNLRSTNSSRSDLASLSGRW